MFKRMVEDRELCTEKTDMVSVNTKPCTKKLPQLREGGDKEEESKRCKRDVEGDWDRAEIERICVDHSTSRVFGVLRSDSEATEECCGFLHPPVETRNPRVLSSSEPTPEEPLRGGGAQGGSGSSPPNRIPNRGGPG